MGTVDTSSLTDTLFTGIRHIWEPLSIPIELISELTILTLWAAVSNSWAVTLSPDFLANLLLTLNISMDTLTLSTPVTAVRKHLPISVFYAIEDTIGALITAFSLHWMTALSCRTSLSTALCIPIPTNTFLTGSGWTGHHLIVRNDPTIHQTIPTLRTASPLGGVTTGGCRAGKRGTRHTTLSTDALIARVVVISEPLIVLESPPLIHTVCTLCTASALHRVLTGYSRAGLRYTGDITVSTGTRHTGVSAVLEPLPVPIRPTLVEAAITLRTAPVGDRVLAFCDGTVRGFTGNISQPTGTSLTPVPRIDKVLLVSVNQTIVITIFTLGTTFASKEGWVPTPGLRALSLCTRCL